MVAGFTRSFLEKSALWAADSQTCPWDVFKPPPAYEIPCHALFSKKQRALNMQIYLEIHSENQWKQDLKEIRDSSRAKRFAIQCEGYQHFPDRNRFFLLWLLFKIKPSKKKSRNGMWCKFQGWPADRSSEKNFPLFRYQTPELSPHDSCLQWWLRPRICGKSGGQNRKIWNSDSANQRRSWGWQFLVLKVYFCYRD